MARYGFNGKKLETKFLILFILYDINGEVTFEELNSLALLDDNADYFIFSECLVEMVESGHLIERDNHYRITQKGADQSQDVYRGLPISLRDAVTEYKKPIIERVKRDNCIKATVERKLNGYYVNLFFNDSQYSMMKLELYAATEDLAQKIAADYRKHAEKMYTEIIKTITMEK